MTPPLAAEYTASREDPTRPASEARLTTEPEPCLPMTVLVLPRGSVSLRRELAAQVLPGDDELHDLGGAVADLQPEHVAQSLLDGEFGAVAVLAVQQQALVDDVVGGLRGPPLAHR